MVDILIRNFNNIYEVPMPMKITYSSTLGKDEDSINKGNTLRKLPSVYVEILRLINYFDYKGEMTVEMDDEWICLRESLRSDYKCVKELYKVEVDGDTRVFIVNFDKYTRNSKIDWNMLKSITRKRYSLITLRDVDEYWINLFNNNEVDKMSSNLKIIEDLMDKGIIEVECGDITTKAKISTEEKRDVMMYEFIDLLNIYCYYY